MSRLGKKPIKIENNVTVDIKDGGRYGYKTIEVKGPKGTLSLDVRRGVEIKSENGEILVTRKDDSIRHKAMHGLYRSLIANLVEGVTKGFVKELELVGVGYRAALKGEALEINIGFTHPVVVNPPQGVKFEVKDQVEITVSGSDKYVVGETAAKIRAIRKPEPYKGKGIRYKGEYVRKKAGKTGAA